jgi:hypothetical protein
VQGEQKMSGGSLDYAYFRLQTLAEDIQEKIDSNHKKDEFGYSDDHSEETICRMKKTVELLIQTSKLSKEVEWLLSGDTGEDTFMERFDKIINPNPAEPEHK